MCKIKKIFSFFLVIIMLLASTSGFFVTALDSNTTGIVLGAEYYIMSANSGLLLSLQSSSNSHGTPLITSSRTNSSTKRWIVQESDSGGSYNIATAYRPNNYCVAMYYDSVCLFSSFVVPFSKLNITRSNNTGYEGLYLISNGEQYLASNSSGQTYVSNTVNADCYWSFMKNEKRDADLYYFYYPDSSRSSGYYDTSASKDSFTSAMSTLGYFDYALKNLPASEAYSYLSTTDDVFIFRGHGTAGRIAFKDQAGNSNGRIVCSTRYTDTSCYDISALSESALSSVRCVLYIGCNTGASYNNANLVDETYAKGAHFVLGTTQTIKTSDNGEWLNLFLEELEDGDNIRQALYDATDRKGTTTITVNGTSVEYVGYPYYCKGDQAQYLQ